MSHPEETPLEILSHVLQRLVFLRYFQPGPWVLVPRPVLIRMIEDCYVAAAALRHHGQGEE